MQRYGQKTSKIPQKWGFSPICDPSRFFFKNWALSLLHPSGTLTSCKKLEKTNERSPKHFKTDYRTDGQGRLLWTPPGKPGIQNFYVFATLLTSCSCLWDCVISWYYCFFPWFIFQYLDSNRTVSKIFHL